MEVNTWEHGHVFIVTNADIILLMKQLEDIMSMPNILIHWQMKFLPTRLLTVHIFFHKGNAQRC